MMITLFPQSLLHMIISRDSRTPIEERELLVKLTDEHPEIYEYLKKVYEERRRTYEEESNNN